MDRIFVVRLSPQWVEVRKAPGPLKKLVHKHTTQLKKHKLTMRTISFTGGEAVFLIPTGIYNYYATTLKLPAVTGSKRTAEVKGPLAEQLTDPKWVAAHLKGSTYVGRWSGV